MKYLIVLPCAVLLTACAAPAGTSTEAAAPAAATAAHTRNLDQAVADKATSMVNDAGLVQTATQPLSDLNLVRAEIPPVLAAAQKNPYAIPADAACATQQSELQALDAALGPDINTTGTPGVSPGLVDQAVGFVGDAAVGTVKSSVHTVVDGVVPFRSWVRKLSGAERHSSAVLMAVSAGTLRRAFLKGWGLAAGCAAPLAQQR